MPEESSSPNAGTGGHTGDDLDAQVDRLLDDVESLTTEILAEPGEAPGPVPASDPKQSVAPDDRDLTPEPPLVVDREPTAIEDVVSDVELELDRAQDKLSALGGESNADTAQDDSPPSAELTTLDDETTDDVLLREMEQLICDTEELKKEVGPVADATEPDAPSPTDSVPAPEGSDVDTELDLLHDLLDEMASDTPEDAPADERPPSVPAPEPPRSVSSQERALDDEINSLLEDAPAAAVAPEPTKAPDPVVEPDDPELESTETLREPLSTDDLQGVSIWRLAKTRAVQRTQHIARITVKQLAVGTVALLELLDRPFKKLSTGTREIIGYCALGTLAMCVIAMVAVLLS